MLLNRSCLPVATPPQQLVPDGSGGWGAGITQLWKVFSTYGWMDEWSCVYLTIFSVLFLKLHYGDHKKARQALAYRCLLLTISIYRVKNRNNMATINSDWWHHRSNHSLLWSLHFFPFQNRTQQNKMKYQVLCVVYKALNDFTSTYSSHCTTLFPSSGNLASNISLLAPSWTCWCTLISGPLYLLFLQLGSPYPWYPWGFLPHWLRSLLKHDLTERLSPTPLPNPVPLLYSHKKFYFFL